MFLYTSISTYRRKKAVVIIGYSEYLALQGRVSFLKPNKPNMEIIKIYQSRIKDNFSMLYLWDAGLTSSFQPIRNDILADYNIRVGMSLDKIVLVYNKPNFKEMEKLKKMKIRSDLKLSSEFRHRAPKEVVAAEIKKNEDITKKLKSY